MSDDHNSRIDASWTAKEPSGVALVKLRGARWHGNGPLSWDRRRCRPFSDAGQPDVNVRRVERTVALPSNYASLSPDDRITLLRSRRNVVLDASKGEPLDRLDWPRVGKPQRWDARA